MLPSTDAYRSLISHFGSDYGSQALKAMRDLVALDHRRTDPDFVDAATGSDIFQKSFVRTSEAYFAFKNAGSIVDGLQFESIKKMSKQICIEFQLDKRPNIHSLKFKFDHEADLPKRIAVIIGKNGVGKSQALGRIARAAIDNDVAMFDGDPGNRVVMNRLLAFAPTNEAGSVFPRERPKNAKIDYRRFSLNRSRAKRSTPGLADKILQTARSEERIAKYTRWSLFLHAIRAIDNWQQIALPNKPEVGGYIALSELTQGGEQRTLEKFSQINLHREPVRLVGVNGYPLSSGEISFLTFSVQSSLNIENGSLLLLDEPETHLHPNFISQFVAVLDRLLEMTGSAAIIATHSVYFVREVFREQVSVLRIDDEGYVQVETPTLRTFGADVGAISYFVFGEDELSRLAARFGRTLRARIPDWDQFFAQYSDELSLELLGALRDDTPEAQE